MRNKLESNYWRRFYRVYIACLSNSRIELNRRTRISKRSTKTCMKFSRFSFSIFSKSIFFAIFFLSPNLISINVFKLFLISAKFNVSIFASAKLNSNSCSRSTQQWRSSFENSSSWPTSFASFKMILKTWWTFWARTKCSWLAKDFWRMGYSAQWMWEFIPWREEKWIIWREIKRRKYSEKRYCMKEFCEAR